MSQHDPLFEPFDAPTLAAIRTAFAAAWHELCNRGPVPSPAQVRNRLAGALAQLAHSGVTDPMHLKERALQRLALAARFN
jgi:hypothetical protein